MSGQRILIALVGAVALALVSTGGGSAQTFYTLSYDDNGSTLNVLVGDSVDLHLLAGMTWEVSVSDETVLTPVSGALPPDVQGRWQAAAPGQVTITANGRPACNPGEVCAQLIIHFQATVLVADSAPPACTTTRAPLGRLVALTMPVQP